MLKLFIQSLKSYFLRHLSKYIFMNENTDQTPKKDIIIEQTDTISDKNIDKNTSKDASGNASENIETVETEEVPNVAETSTETVAETPNTDNIAENVVENPAQETVTETVAENTLEDNARKVAQELAEQKDKYLRLLADFENFRRRTAKEKIEFLEQANAKLILELLPVLDDFERAAKSMEAPETSIESVKNGITLVYGKFLKSLERQGLMPIHSNGEVFDVEKHEAITQIPAPTEDLRGKIVDTVEKGYTLGEKVVRFAKVVIGQ